MIYDDEVETKMAPIPRTKEAARKSAEPKSVVSVTMLRATSVASLDRS